MDRTAHRLVDGLILWESSYCSWLYLTLSLCRAVGRGADRPRDRMSLRELPEVLRHSLCSVVAT